MMNYGLPYKGSKNTIAPWVVGHLPSAGTLVDLFCGGCAVTHAAMLSGRWDRYIANDIVGVVPQAFRDAVSGKYRGEERWISREEFFRLKDTDGYVRCCWSFGNNGRDYIYSREVEPYKRALHYAVFWRDYGPLKELMPEVSGEVERRLNRLENRKERRIEIGRGIVTALNRLGKEERSRLIAANPLYKMIRGQKLQSLQSLESLERLQSLESLESLERLERLQRLQSLERLESLESLERLEISSMDYREVRLPDDCVVYADPPYKGADGYNHQSFDHDAFWEWVRHCPHPVYVSEYSAPDDIIEVAARTKRSLISATANVKATKRLFCNRAPMRTTLF